MRNETSEEQVIQLRKYYQKLTPLVMFFMMFGIIIPIIGVVMAVILTPVISAGKLGLTSTHLICVFVLIAIIQYILSGWIEGLRSKYPLLNQASLSSSKVIAPFGLYEIFILFSGIIGTPFLFAVAGKLIEMFEKQKTAFLGDTSNLPSLFGPLMQGSKGAEPLITSSEFFYFALATIFVTSIFSSLILSVIRTGTKNEGLNYFPFILIAAYIVYIIVSSVLSLLFVTLT